MSLDFAHVKPVEFPVNNLLGKNYIVKDPKGGAVARYEAVRVAAARMDDGRVTHIAGEIVDAGFNLVGECMYEVTESGVAKSPVGAQFVKDLPNQVSEQLIAKVKELGGVDLPTTEADIRKQMSNLQKQLRKIRKEESGLDGPKDEQSNSTDGSE